MKTTITITERKDGTLKLEVRFVCDRASRNVWEREDYEGWKASESVREMSVPNIGELYMVASSEYVGPNRGPNFKTNPKLFWKQDNGKGWGGNSDQNVKRYHGWRGTSDDWCVTGLGVRKCLDVYQTGERSKRVVVIFGKDLKKDEA